MIKFQGQIPINTDYVLYQCPKGYKAVLGISFNNTGVSNATISLGRLQAPKAAYTDSDYQWQDYVVEDSLGYPEEWTGLTLSSGNILIAKTNLANVNFLVHGFELPVIGKFTSENDWLELGTSINVGVTPEGYLTNKLNFQDNADQDTLINYTQFDDSGTGVWTFNTNKFQIASSSSYSRLISSNTIFSSVNHSAYITVTNQLQAGLVFRHSNSSNYYAALITASNSSVTPNRIELIKRVAGTYTTLANTTTFVVSNLKTHKLKVVAVGTSIQVYLNGQVVINTTDASLTAGAIGIISNSLAATGTATFSKINASSDFSSTTASFSRASTAIVPDTYASKANNESRSILDTKKIKFDSAIQFGSGTHNFTALHNNYLAIPNISHTRGTPAFDNQLNYYTNSQARYEDVVQPISVSRQQDWNSGTFAGLALNSSNQLSVPGMTFTRSTGAYGKATSQLAPVNTPRFEDDGLLIERGVANVFSSPIATCDEGTASFSAVGVGVTLGSTNDAWQGSKSVVAFTTGSIGQGIQTANTTVSANSARAVALYAKCSQPVQASLLEYSAGGTLLATTLSNISSGSGDWERLVIFKTTNASTSYCVVQVLTTTAAGPTAIQTDAYLLAAYGYANAWTPNGSAATTDLLVTSGSGIGLNAGMIRFKVGEEFKVGLSNSGHGHILISAYNGSNNNYRTQLYQLGNTISFLAYSSTGASASASWIYHVSNYSPGWHSMGYTWVGTTVELFVDGVSQGTQNIGLTPQNYSTTFVGPGYGATIGTPETYVRDLVLWNTAPSQSEMIQYTSSNNSAIPITDSVAFYAPMRSDLSFYRRGVWTSPWYDTNVVNAGYTGFTKLDNQTNGGITYQFRSNSVGQDSGASSFVTNPSQVPANRFIQTQISIVKTAADSNNSTISNLAIQTVNYGKAIMLEGQRHAYVFGELSKFTNVTATSVTKTLWPKPEVPFVEAWNFADNSTNRTLTINLPIQPGYATLISNTTYRSVLSFYVTKSNNTAPTFTTSGASDIKASINGSSVDWQNIIISKVRDNIYRVSAMYPHPASITTQAITIFKTTGDSADQITVAGVQAELGFGSLPTTLRPTREWSTAQFQGISNISPRGYHTGGADNLILPGKIINLSSGSIVFQVSANSSNSAPGGYHRFFNAFRDSAGSANNRFTLQLAQADGKLTFVTGNNAGTLSTLISSSSVVNGAYNTIGVSWSSTALKIYLNGSLVGTLSGSINLPSVALDSLFISSLTQMANVYSNNYTFFQTYNTQLSDATMQTLTKGNIIPVPDVNTLYQVLFNGDLNQTAVGQWTSAWTDSYFTKTKLTGYTLSGTGVTKLEFRSNSAGIDSGASPWVTDITQVPANTFVQVRVTLQDTATQKARLNSLVLNTQIPDGQAVIVESGTTNMLVSASAPAAEQVTVTSGSTHWLSTFRDQSRAVFTRASTGYDYAFNSYANNVPVFAGELDQLGTVNLLTPNGSSAETDTTTGITLVGSPIVTRTTSWKMSGSYSFQVANSSSVNKVRLTSSTVVAAESKLTGSAYVYNPNSQPIEIFIATADSNEVSFVIAAGQTTRVFSRGIVSALGTSSMTLREAANKTFFFDQAQLENNPDVTNWVVGGAFRKVSYKQQGLVIHTGHSQLVHYTEDLSNAYWTKTNSTVALSSYLSPRGDSTVYKLQEDNTNNTHSLSRPGALSAGITSTHTFFVKALERSRLRISTGTHHLDLDIVNGQVLNTVNPAAYNQPKFTYYGDGWWRVSVVFYTSTTTTNDSMIFSLLDDTNNVSYTGTTGAGLLLWGINLMGNFVRWDVPYSPRATASAEGFAASLLEVKGPALSGRNLSVSVKLYEHNYLDTLQRSSFSLQQDVAPAGTGLTLNQGIANIDTSYGARLYDPFYDNIRKSIYNTRNEIGSVQVNNNALGSSMMQSKIITLGLVSTDNNLRSYVNGIESTLITYRDLIALDILDYSKATLRIGSSNASGSQINSWITEAQIYNTALSSMQMQAVANGTQVVNPTIKFDFSTGSVQPIEGANQNFRPAVVASRSQGSTSSWADWSTSRVTNSSGNWTITASAAPTFARASTAVDQFGSSISSGTPRYAQGMNILRQSEATADGNGTVGVTGSWSLEGSGAVTISAEGVNLATMPNPLYNESAALFGNYSLAVTINTAAANQGIRQSTGSRSWVKPNTQYTCSAWVRHITTISFNYHMIVTFYNDDTLINGVQGSNTLVSNYMNPSRVSHTFTTPANCNRVELAIRRVESSAVGWRVDGVQLEEGATASGFLRPGPSHATHAGNSLGAIMIEEGTTNLVPTGASQTFAGSWSNYSGSTPTLTQTQTDPFGGTRATRIQTTGGSDILKYYYSGTTGTNGVPFTTTLWVKNQAASAITVHNNFTFVTIPATSGWTPVTITSTANGAAIRQILFKTVSAGTDLDVLAYQPQVEEKAYATSYYDAGTRAAETLTIPVSAYGSAAANASGTAMFVVYADGETVSGTTASRDYYLMSMGTPGAANSFRLYKASGATSQITFEAVDNAGTARSFTHPGTGLVKGWNAVGVNWHQTAQAGIVINGSSQTSSGWPSGAYMPTTWSATYIGSSSAGTGQWNQPIDDFRLHDNSYAASIAGVSFGDKSTILNYTSCRTTYRLKFENSLTYGRAGFIVTTTPPALANIGTTGSYSTFRVVGSSLAGSNAYFHVMLNGTGGFPVTTASTYMIPGLNTYASNNGNWQLTTVPTTTSANFDVPMHMLTPGLTTTGWSYKPVVGLVSEDMATYNPVLSLATFDIAHEVGSDINRIVPATNLLYVDPKGLSKWQLENSVFPTSWQPNGTARSRENISVTASNIINTSGWTIAMAVRSLNRPSYKTTMPATWTNVFFQIGGNITNGFMKLWQNHNGIGYQIQDSSGGAVSNTLVTFTGVPRDHDFRIAITQTSSNTFYFFINGVKYGPVTTTNPITSWNSDTLRLGSTNDSGAHVFSRFSAAKTVVPDVPLLDWTSGNDSATQGYYPFDIAFNAGTTGQQAQGIWISNWIDSQYSKNLHQELDIIQTVPSDTTVSYEYRASNKSDYSDASAWTTNIASIQGRYVQIRVTLTSNNAPTNLAVIKHLDLISKYGIS